MNRRMVTFITTSGCLLFIWVLYYLVGIWEEGAKRGYAQIVFMIGVVLGMVINFILLRIEARTSEKTQNQE